MTKEEFEKIKEWSSRVPDYVLPNESPDEIQDREHNFCIVASRYLPILIEEIERLRAIMGGEL